MPSIKTNKAELIELLPEFSKDVFDFASNEQVAKTVIWDAHQSVHDSIQYIERVRKKLSYSEGAIFLCWAVREKESKKVIGLVSLTELAPIRAQIGYVFHYGHWNTNLPVECIQSVTQFAFQEFGSFERLQCRCFPTNPSSINLLERVGFQFEGVNHAMVKVRGQLQDLACFAMTRKRWAVLGDARPENDVSDHS